MEFFTEGGQLPLKGELNSELELKDTFCALYPVFKLFCK